MILALISRIAGYPIVPFDVVLPVLVIFCLSHVARWGKWWDKFRHREAEKHLRPHGGLICLRCHYPLTSLPPEGRCPECGLEFEAADVVRRWSWAYKGAEFSERSALKTASDHAINARR